MKLLEDKYFTNLIIKGHIIESVLKGQTIFAVVKKYCNFLNSMELSNISANITSKIFFLFIYVMNWRKKIISNCFYFQICRLWDIQRYIV